MAPASELPVIDPDALRPGDVLLSRGIGSLSDLIVELDGGAYSHSAVFDGEKLVEATTSGIVRNPPRRDPETQEYVHAYRFHDREGRALDAPGLPSRPVTEEAISFVGGKYAYDELFMLAVLFYVRGRAALPYLRDVIRLLGGAALERLHRLIERIRHDRRTAMTCTEVVASSYWKPSDSQGVPYGLRVKVWRPRLRAAPVELTPELARDYEALRDEIGKRIEEARPGLPAALEAQRALREGELPPSLRGAAPGGVLPDEVIAGGPLLAAGCVAPYDLETSPSLRCVGRLP